MFLLRHLIMLLVRRMMMIKSKNVMSIEEYRKKTSSKSKKRGSPEHDEQVRVFEWAEVMSNKCPELELLMAIPNGAYYGGHWSVAHKMKAEGVKKGVPDIFLPVGRCDDDNEYGLWIEMKVGYNKTSDEQDWWLGKLEDQGYRVRVCYGYEEAVEEICDYLNLNEK